MIFNDLKGKRVLITGSTMGIGWAIAQAFAQNGAKVGINSHEKPDNLQRLLDEIALAGGQAAFFQADLKKSDDCKKLIDEFVVHYGGLDVLINNAGGLGGRSGLESIDDEFYDRVMDLNARSVLMTTKYAIPHLRQSAKASGQSSAVISTGSIAGREGGGIGAGVYAASKAWLHDIHRNWVKEFTKDGIRFNIVSPGTVDTVFHADKSDDLKARIAASIPMGRFGQTAELSPSYLFFASHAASGYVTGQILDVNGGQICP